MSKICNHIIVSGKVQGVFFRASAKNIADQLGIVGTVENLQDGSVEIYAQGDEGDMEKWLEWCSHGPPNSIVKSLKINNIQLQDFTNFKVVRI